MDERSTTLRFVIRTPSAAVVDVGVDAVRIPGATGQFGLRPRAEPMVTEVVAGLVVMRVGGQERYAATAGGLVEVDRTACTIYTPFAVEGAADDVLEALAEVTEASGSDLAARRQLEVLEQRILHEIRHPPSTGRRVEGAEHG